MILALKLVVTPLLIGAATLAGRRWGPAASGWLVGLPFTSGPVVFFVALTHGTAFAGQVASGILAGTASQAAFALGYAWIALRWPWPVALLSGSAGFAVATAAWFPLGMPVVAVTAIVIGSLVAALAFLSRYPLTRRRLKRSRGTKAPLAWAGGPAHKGQGEFSVSAAPAWDLPARMIVGTALVVLLTELAALLGPRLTGLLSPFPLYAAVLTVFVHRGLGAMAALEVLRGLLFGLFAFTAFFLILALGLDRMGIAVGFVLALAVALGFQGASLMVIRR